METRAYAVMEFGGKEYEVDRRPTGKSGSRPKAFVFGPGDRVDDTHLFELAKKLGLPGPFTTRGAYPEMDKAWDEHNKKVVAEKREALKKALSFLGFDPESLKLAFSRKAGCGCGCSPGFYLKNGGTGYELFISEKKSVEKPVEREPSFVDFYEKAE